MSKLFGTLRAISKDITKEMANHDNKKSSDITPISKLNRMRKYKIDVELKQLKKEDEYQLLVWFTDTGIWNHNAKYLVYATRKGDLKKVTERRTKWITNFKAEEYDFTYIRWENHKASAKFESWAWNFRNKSEILTKVKQSRLNAFKQSVA